MTALARLSFWVAPERMDEFDTAYESKLVPILIECGLVESTEEGRPTVEGVFSRLFELTSAAEIDVAQSALWRSAPWEEAMQLLGATFSSSPIHFSFRPYRTFAGNGAKADTGPGSCKGLWHVYSVRDGLPSPDIRVIYVDRSGQLWLGAFGAGATRYDGAEFTTFTPADGLASTFVTCFLEDREGNLWIGTENGVSRYDGEQFTTFTREDGLINNEVWSMLEDRAGTIWFGTSGDCGYRGVAMVHYDGVQFTSLDLGDGPTDPGAKSIMEGCVRSIAEDRQGHLWFTTRDGLCRYDGQQSIHCTAADSLGRHGMCAILEDRQGHMWFATGWQWLQQAVGVTRYDGAQFVTFTTEDGLAGNNVSSILEDQEGRLWFGTSEGGASCYDGQCFVSFGEDYLGSNWVKSIAQDQEGRLWFGTQGGICRYDGMYIANFTTRDGLINNGVMCALEDRSGTLWFGTWDGICAYDGTGFTLLEGSQGKNARALDEDEEGYLWLAALGNGVSRYDRRKMTALTIGDELSKGDGFAFLRDREGALWIGTGQGVSRYDGQGVVIFASETQLGHYRVMSMLEDRKGYLWIGTGGGGASRYDGQLFTTFNTSDGLGHNDVFAILEDGKGYLWFGTKGGLSCYDGQTWTNFTTADGLAGNWVTAICADRHGDLWLGTFGGGISRYNGEVFQTLSTSGGLVHDTVQDIIQDRRGDFWIATEGGVTRYRPGSTPPVIRLVRTVADRDYGAVEEVHLSAGQGVVAFEFQGSSYTTGAAQMVYRYRLHGCEEERSQTRRPRVEYTQLPQGKYVFEVQAIDRDLNYSEPVAVHVVVEPDPRLQAFAETFSVGEPAQEFVGNSPALRRVQALLADVARADVTVLIQGETGVGKGLAARMLHALSQRRGGPFVQVNCGALPEGLVESELFGHERGAFTGATSKRLGKVELAEAGTLLLDEIGDLPLIAQVKLLRVLEERTFERVGGSEILKSDARIVAITNRNLEQMVAIGQFRQDLYYRLQTFPVWVPPLRQRREDISLLATYFAGRMAAHLDKRIVQINEEVLVMLEAYTWPGNVRELEHAVQRAVIVCPGPQIRTEDLALGVQEERPIGVFVSLEEHERRYIREVLEKTGWIIGGVNGAAAILDLPESTLRNRMHKLGIQRPHPPHVAGGRHMRWMALNH